MDEKELIKDNVVNILFKGKKYFLVASLKEKYGDVKTEDAIDVDNKRYVLAKNVAKFTAFDKNIKKALNFKPKK